MKNQEMRILEMTRHEMCDIRLALTSIIVGYKRELRNEDLSPEKRVIAENALQKWQNLKAKVINQLENQDK